MSDTRDGLIRTVLCNPRCEVARGVLGDWFEEDGQAELAVRVRTGGWWRPAWIPVNEPAPWCWYRGVELFSPTNPSEVPQRVFARLRPTRGTPEYAELVGYIDQDDAYDDLSRAARLAFDQLSRIA